MEATISRPGLVSVRPSALWTGRVLTGVLALFLFVDGGGKLLRLPMYVEGTEKAGFSQATLLPLGLWLVVATVLWLVPRTTVLGAIALTAYLGGAVCAMVHLHQPFVFPLAFGVLVWIAGYLRSARVRSLVA